MGLATASLELLLVPLRAVLGVNPHRPIMMGVKGFALDSGC